MPKPECRAGPIEFFPNASGCFHRFSLHRMRLVVVLYVDKMTARPSAHESAP
jgi:hypothetical protein